MQYILLPEAGENNHYYRANLHCHTIISDGKKTPEQVKADYMAHGYDIVAYTDHNLFVRHNDLSDEHFLALNGLEVNINDWDFPVEGQRLSLHMNFLAMSPDIENQVCYHRTKYVKEDKYMPGARNLVKFDPKEPDFERLFTEKCVNEMIDKAHEAGFFVTYNHPTWSQMSYPDYAWVHHADAVEIYNHGTFVMGHEELNARVYEDFCRTGRRVQAFATDDNHNKVPDKDPACDSYGGATMICAPELSYRAIAEAIRNGRTYATIGSSFERGPEIRFLAYDPENRTVTVKTSNVRRIALSGDTRKPDCARTLPGETVSEAVLKLHEDSTMFRIALEDEKGYRAYSRMYFLDEFK